MATIPQCDSPQPFDWVILSRSPQRNLSSPSPPTPLENSLYNEASSSDPKIIVTPESSLLLDNVHLYFPCKPSLLCDPEVLHDGIAVAIQGERHTLPSCGRASNLGLYEPILPSQRVTPKPPATTAFALSSHQSEMPYCPPNKDCRMAVGEISSSVASLSEPCPSVLEEQVEPQTDWTTSPSEHDRDDPAELVCDLSEEVENTGQFSVAHGAFSDIHKGVWKNPLDEGEKTEVAIKLLRACTRQKLDTVRAKKRLDREVYVWKRLRHPNIARFYGVSFHMGGRPSLVMQWYRNGTVPDYINEQRKGGTKVDRLLLIKDIAEGLNYLHSLDPPVVHGDLKGNNILVSDDGRAMLTDFGLSKVLEELAGPTGNTTSTRACAVRWQAPELFLPLTETNDEKEGDSGRTFELCSPTLASDVWSFGCTVYEIMTGNIPHHTLPHDWTVVLAIKDKQCPIRHADRKVLESSGLMPLLQHCWQYDREKRPEIRDILRKFLRVPRCQTG